MLSLNKMQIEMFDKHEDHKHMITVEPFWSLL